MLTSSKLQFYSLFSILYSLFFTLPVNAVAPADQVPEHKAPYYAFPITSIKPTADQYDYPSEMGDKFLLGAFVEHIDKGTLFGNLMGDEEFRDEVNRFGRDNIINLIPRRTISFDADQEIYDLLKKGDGDDLTIVTGVADYISVLSKNQDSNPSLFMATCHYLELETPRDCAIALNMTFNNPEAPDSISVNKLSTSNWYQMLTPIKLQTGNGPTGLFKNAQDTKRTREVGSGNVMHSGNMNCVTQNCATSNLDFADSVLDAIPSGGVTADQIAAKQLFKYMGHQRTTSENFFVLFRPNPENLNPIEKLAYRIGLFEPIIVRGYIPGLPQLAEMIKFKAKMTSTAKNAGRIDSLFGKARDGIPKGATIEKKLENLVLDEVGYTCGEVVAPLQDRGVNATTNSFEDFGLEFDFTVLEPNFPEEIPDMPVYCAELIGPRELKAIEALFSWAPDALSRKYYSVVYEDNFTYDTKNLIRIPQPIMDQKKVRTTPKQVNCQATGEMEACVLPDGGTGMCPVTTCDQVTVAYSKGTNASLPTGVVENFQANFNFMALMPLDSERGLNWDTACYEKETTSRFDANPAKQSLIAAVGGGLAKITGKENLGVVEGFTCGKVYTRAKKVLASPTEGDICAVANEYNIPCCQLEGIIETETRGMSDPSQTGGTGYCQTSQKVFNCCSGGMCGPAQIACLQYDAWDGGDGLDMCDPVGAAELLARAMILKECQAQEIGGPCDTRYDWKANGEYAMSKYSPITDYNAAAYFYGISNGCAVTPCSQYRWGAGNSYCDSVELYCNTGKILPESQDMSFCAACNEEIIRAGQTPMSCQQP